MLHSALTTTLGNHVVQAWQVADAAALAALVPVAADIGKIAYQVDTKEFHLLTNNVGPIWYKLTETSGTFTPTIFGATTAGANTYGTQVGFYRRFGKTVHVQGRIVLTAKDAAMAGAVRIGGLPFTSLNTANSFAAAKIGYYSDIIHPAGALALGSIVEVNAAQLNLYWLVSNGVPAGVVPADLTAISGIIFSATYIANS
jgi:hypothetical protein